MRNFIDKTSSDAIAVNMPQEQMEDYIRAFLQVEEHKARALNGPVSREDFNKAVGWMQERMIVLHDNLRRYNSVEFLAKQRAASMQSQVNCDIAAQLDRERPSPTPTPDILAFDANELVQPGYTASMNVFPRRLGLRRFEVHRLVWMRGEPSAFEAKLFTINGERVDGERTTPPVWVDAGDETRGGVITIAMKNITDIPQRCIVELHGRGVLATQAQQ